MKFAEFSPLSVAIASEGLTTCSGWLCLRPCIAAALSGAVAPALRSKSRVPFFCFSRFVLKMAGAVDNVNADLHHFMDQSRVPAEIEKVVRGWDPAREGVCGVVCGGSRRVGNGEGEHGEDDGVGGRC